MHTTKRIGSPIWPDLVRNGILVFRSSLPHKEILEAYFATYALNLVSSNIFIWGTRTVKDRFAGL